MSSTQAIILFLLSESCIIATHAPQDALPHNLSEETTPTQRCVLKLPDEPPSQLYSLCNKILQLDQEVCDLEKKTSAIFAENNITNLETTRGAGCTEALATYTLYRTQKDDTPSNRFLPDGGLLTMGGASMIGSAVKYVGALIVGAYAWHSFKRWIVEPYRLRHQEEIEKFKMTLIEHKRNIGQTQQSFTQVIEESLQHIQSTIAAELKTVRHDYTQLDQKQNTLQELVKVLDAKLQDDFKALQRDVKNAQSITQEVKEGMATALPKLAQMLLLVRQIDQKTQQELERINKILDDKTHHEKEPKKSSTLKKFFTKKKD